MITFAIFVWFTMRFVWPPLVAAMDLRQKKIADGLAAAEKGQKALDDAQLLISKDYKQAKLDVITIIENANKKAALIMEESKHKAKQEGLRLLEVAKVEISQELQQARQSLKNEVAQIAVSGMEKIIKESLDDKTQQKLIDEVIGGIQ